MVREMTDSTDLCDSLLVINVAIKYVIPAKTRVTGASRNPEIFETIPFSWIPDLTSLRSVRPE
jgi:hypothetical protein